MGEITPPGEKLDRGGVGGILPPAAKPIGFYANITTLLELAPLAVVLQLNFIPERLKLLCFINNFTLLGITIAHSYPKCPVYYSPHCYTCTI